MANDKKRGFLSSILGQRKEVVKQVPALDETKEVAEGKKLESKKAIPPKDEEAHGRQGVKATHSISEDTPATRIHRKTKKTGEINTSEKEFPAQSAQSPTGDIAHLYIEDGPELLTPLGEEAISPMGDRKEEGAVARETSHPSKKSALAPMGDKAGLVKKTQTAEDEEPPKSGAVLEGGSPWATTTEVSDMPLVPEKNSTPIKLHLISESIVSEATKNLRPASHGRQGDKATEKEKISDWPKIGFRYPPSLLKKLDWAHIYTRRSKQELINTALDEYLNSMGLPGAPDWLK